MDRCKSDPAFPGRTGLCAIPVVARFLHRLPTQTQRLQGADAVEPDRIDRKPLLMLIGGLSSHIRAVCACENVMVFQKDGTAFQTETLASQLHRAPTNAVDVEAMGQFIGRG